MCDVGQWTLVEKINYVLENTYIFALDSDKYQYGIVFTQLSILKIKLMVLRSVKSMFITMKGNEGAGQAWELI